MRKKKESQVQAAPVTIPISGHWRAKIWQLLIEAPKEGVPEQAFLEGCNTDSSRQCPLNILGKLVDQDIVCSAMKQTRSGDWYQHYWLVDQWLMHVVRVADTPATAIAIDSALAASNS